MSGFTGALQNLMPASAVAGSAKAQARTDSTAAASQGSFTDALNASIGQGGSLKFSKHAANRLKDRDISLTDGQLASLDRAADKAAEKGARDALMMLGNLNLIVSIGNRTVVTAMQPGESEDAVYTNIDTAVIVGDEETGQAE